MTEFSPAIAKEVLATCQAGAEEASGALARGLDGSFEWTPGDARTLDFQEPTGGFDGSGLAIVIKLEQEGAIALLPESSGLLPEWYSAPDSTQQSKLNTLAQELSMLMLPDEFISDRQQAAQVTDLGAALERGQPIEGAAVLPLLLNSDDPPATLTFIWPIANPDAVFDPEPSQSTSTAAPEPQAPSPDATVDSNPREPGETSSGFVDQLTRLPIYARSLLKVKVPVVVHLATKKQPIGQIVELCPGTIIKFDKSCDEMLELNVGGCTIASGEAVKVGDKFGLRISSMAIPSERFHAVKP